MFKRVPQWLPSAPMTLAAGDGTGQTQLVVTDTQVLVCLYVWVDACMLGWMGVYENVCACTLCVFFVSPYCKTHIPDSVSVSVGVYTLSVVNGCVFCQRVLKKTAGQSVGQWESVCHLKLKHSLV